MKQVLRDAQLATRGAFSGSRCSTRATSEKLIASIVSMDTCRSTIIVLPSGIGEPRKKISSSQESTVNDQEGPVGEDAGEQVEQRAIGASPSRLCLQASAADRRAAPVD